MPDDTKECPFCAETIKVKAKKCRFCGEWLDDHSRDSILSDQTIEDQIMIGDLSEVSGVAVGRAAQGASIGDVGGSFIQAQGDVTLGKKQRDEQYEIALNWEAKGKPRMRGFDLSGQDLARLKFESADFTQANLSRAQLWNSNLKNANLSEANLREASLRRADLSWANLYGANLQGAGLQYADLSYVVLVKADLSGANLQGAELKLTPLQRASLLQESDLKDPLRVLQALKSEGDSQLDTKLQGAKYDRFTTWPPGFDPKAAGAKMVD